MPVTTGIQVRYDWIPVEKHKHQAKHDRVFGK